MEIFLSRPTRIAFELLIWGTARYSDLKFLNYVFCMDFFCDKLKLWVLWTSRFKLAVIFCNVAAVNN